MDIIKINEQDISAALKASVRVLKNGGVIAYPTETFYGLGVKFDMEDALRRLHALKGRPPEKAMSLIIGDMDALSGLALSVNETVRRLIEKFWPGPLTLLLPAKETLSGYITCRGKVAVRMPGSSTALELVRASGFPITATSANPSGMPPAETAGKVVEYFGKDIDLLLDAGRTPGGLASTVVDTEGGGIKIIRQGAIKVSE